MPENISTISLTDGRHLSIIEAGVPDGIPVLTLHGTPGSRLIAPSWVEDAHSRGIRLISYDRPGYGGSSPHPGRSVASVTEDVAALAEQLGIDRLFVWGISGGGPHALACAALLPELVPAVASLASPAPYPADGLDWFAGMGEDNIVEFNAALESREAVEKFIEAQTPGLLGADAKGIVAELSSLLSAADAAVLTEDYASFMIDRMNEGIKDRRDGWIDDDIAFTKPWGFELDQIKTPLLLMQGALDKFVPFAHGEWLAARIPGAEARLLPDDGHLTLTANRIPEVHTWLLDKMG
ncbi:MAG: alpha/beta hydrolase [Chloroflexota bacterium]